MWGSLTKYIGPELVGGLLPAETGHSRRRRAQIDQKQVESETKRNKKESGDLENERDAEKR